MEDHAVLHGEEISLRLTIGRTDVSPMFLVECLKLPNGSPDEFVLVHLQPLLYRPDQHGQSAPSFGDMRDRPFLIRCSISMPLIQSGSAGTET